MTESDVITPAHRLRRAVIYVRQSTPQQVLSNTESQRLQYALRQRAEEYGWVPSAVDVIDADLGQSGRSIEGRVGFAALVARVDQGLVGVIFAYYATRLSRNCTDWYHLLDLCGLRRCLIGDKDGVYDPASINGRLLLGLKGQISELEAFTIKARLTAGLRQKARRGELVVSLPVGLVRDPAGRVVKHPDVGVTERIDLVFATFTRLRTVQGVVREFRDAGLTLPRREFGAGAAAVVWRRPTSAAVTAFLRNPAYAGTYTYGRIRCRAAFRSLLVACRARTTSRIASWTTSGTQIAVSSPARASRANATASRWSFFTRSPGFRGMCDGATTTHACPTEVKR
jgi:DNA invertase Pin-like site-specific DNA recombinase